MIVHWSRKLAAKRGARGWRASSAALLGLTRLEQHGAVARVMDQGVREVPAVVARHPQRRVAGVDERALRRVWYVGRPQVVREAAPLARLDQHPVRRGERRVEPVRVEAASKRTTSTPALRHLSTLRRAFWLSWRHCVLLVGVERQEHPGASTPAPARRGTHEASARRAPSRPRSLLPRRVDDQERRVSRARERRRPRSAAMPRRRPAAPGRTARTGSGPAPPDAQSPAPMPAGVRRVTGADRSRSWTDTTATGVPSRSMRTRSGRQPPGRLDLAPGVRLERLAAWRPDRRARPTRPRTRRVRSMTSITRSGASVASGRSVDSPAASERRPRGRRLVPGDGAHGGLDGPLMALARQQDHVTRVAPARSPPRWPRPGRR